MYVYVPRLYLVSEEGKKEKKKYGPLEMNCVLFLLFVLYFKTEFFSV